MEPSDFSAPLPFSTHFR